MFFLSEKKKNDHKLKHFRWLVAMVTVKKVDQDIFKTSIFEICGYLKEIKSTCCCYLRFSLNVLGLT